VIAVVWFQAILDAFGWVLARFYDVVPNYGVAIILLTLVIRILLLPLGIKQIRSMQATAVMQPKMKAIQQKYKHDRQRQQEEMMKLYKEYGYNPLSGCFPLLAQLPVLIALFAVLQFPKGLTHIPTDSKLFVAISHQNTHFVGANLVCSAVQSGNPAVEAPAAPAGITLETKTLDCGKGAASRIPYYLFALFMVGTTYFQQRQIQRSSPAAAQNTQQQTIMRVMPLLFGVWGFIFPAGLVVYWTTTNAIQIGQQYVLIHRKGAPLAPKAIDDGEGKGAKGAKGPSVGRAASGGRNDQRRTTRGTNSRAGGGNASARKTSGSAKSVPFGGRRSGVSRSGSAGSSGGGGRTGRPKPGANGGSNRRQSGGDGGSSGTRDARDRKKRPDR
jgi:YidC/Oxa1 family membrane protein insertase